MILVGMDFHLKSTSFCILSERGETLSERTIRGRWPKVVEYMKDVKQKYGKVSVCFEASGSSGHLYDQLRPIVDRITVAHPGQTRLIFRSKKKNDRIDAAKLAKLLFIGEVPPVYIPAKETRQWRQFIEHRERLIRKRTRDKNEIRGLLNNNGVIPPSRLWTRKGMAWLRDLDFGDGFAQNKLCFLLTSLDFHNQSIRLVERQLAEYAKRRPEVHLLMTIPGIGIRTAECIVAYIDDWRRFPSDGEVSSYFGLVPWLDSTAGKDHLGHITKAGPATARRLLVEASWYAVRKSDTVKKRFDRISRGDKDQRKIAIVAVAHYLVRVCYAMLKSGECWREAA